MLLHVSHMASLISYALAISMLSVAFVNDKIRETRTKSVAIIKYYKVR